MKIITKFSLLLTLALISIVSANATKKYATYGTPASSGSWDAETGTYSWTAGYSNLMTIFSFSNGELADYTSVHLTTSNYNSGPYRICFMNGSTAVATIAFYSAGQKDLVLSERDETKDLDLSQITHISFGGASGAGSITLSKAYLKKPLTLEFDENGEAEIDLTDLTASGCYAFDDQTGELTLTATESSKWGRLEVDLPSEGIDLSAVTSIKMNRSGDDIVNTLQITDADNGVLNTWYGSKYSCDFTNYASKASHVTKIRWESSSANDGTMTISSIKLKANVIVATRAGETMLNKLQYHKFSDGSNATAAWNIGTSTGTYYGSGSSDANYFVDLTGYEELRIYRDDQTAFRAFFINADGSGTNTYTQANATWNAKECYYAIDLSTIERYEEKVYLNTIKSQYSWVSNAVNNIVVYNSPELGTAQYMLTGSGVKTAGAKSALADETATLIDATAVTGSNVDLTTANPNCIILASDGVLANPQNVCVDGVIASLNLTDGYPLSVPATSTSATTASYTRTMSNTYGTICLPFAVDASETNKYYAIETLDDDVLTVSEMESLPAGTPAIVEKVSGEGVNATGTGILVEAMKTDGNLPMIGTYEQQTIMAADYDNPIYAISNNQFVKAKNSITLTPFRAFFTGASSETKLRISKGGVADAINAIGEDTDCIISDVYGLDGVQRNGFQKGVNVIRMSNGKIAKILVK